MPHNTVVRRRRFGADVVRCNTGTIRSISSVPASVQTATGTTIAYTVEVVFPEGMRTTYEKELPMIQQMDGTGEIITEDMRLIEQFIQPVVSLFKNR